MQPHHQHDSSEIKRPSCDGKSARKQHSRQPTTCTGLAEREDQTMGKKKQQQEKDEHGPAWMDEENDEKHREEAPLLFGEGSIDLKDPPKKKDEEEEEELPINAAVQKLLKQKSKKKDYGTATKKTTTTDEEKMEEGAEVLLDSSEAKYVKSKLVDPETLKPHTPRYNPCLYMFHLFEGVTTVVCCVMLVTQIFPFFVMKFKSIGFLVTVLKIYISLFCLLFVLTETGAPVPLVRRSALLQPYASRGFLYSFLGLICLEEAYSERVKDMMAYKDQFHISWAPLFMQIASWCMVSCGVLYMLLGICCLKRIRDRLQQNEIDAWKEYRKGMREWKERFG